MVQEVLQVVHEDILKKFRRDLLSIELLNLMREECFVMRQSQCKLKEIFVVANVKQPLVALMAMGKWMKKGWMIQNVKDKFYLRRNT